MALPLARIIPLALIWLLHTFYDNILFEIVGSRETVSYQLLTFSPTLTLPDSKWLMSDDPWKILTWTRKLKVGIRLFLTSILMYGFSSHFDDHKWRRGILPPDCFSMDSADFRCHAFTALHYYKQIFSINAGSYFNYYSLLSSEMTKSRGTWMQNGVKNRFPPLTSMHPTNSLPHNHCCTSSSLFQLAHF